MAKQKPVSVGTEAIKEAKRKAELMSMMSDTTHKVGEVKHDLLLSIRTSNFTLKPFVALCKLLTA